METPTSLATALRRTRFSVLALLACCAGVVALRGFADDEPPPDRWWTTAAVVIGLGTIVLRRLAVSPAIRPPRTIWLLLGSLGLSACLGLLGVVVAYTGDAARTGILFSLAGALFTIRPTGAVASGRGSGH